MAECIFKIYWQNVCFATNWKVGVSIPDGVIGIFH